MRAIHRGILTTMHFSRAADRLVLRKQLWRVLHHGHGLTGHAFNFLLVLFILLSIAILPLEFLPAFTRYHGTLLLIEIIVTSVFTIEYLLRVWAAPSRMRYIFSFFGVVDLLSILPFYLGLLGTQYIRVLRLVRLLRLGEIEAAAAADEEDTMEHGIGIVEGEQVQHVITHHPVFLLYSCLPPLLSTTAALAILFLFPPHPITVTVSATLFLFALLFLWKAWLDYSYDVIYLTSRRMIFQNQHILGRSINQINYHTITNVKPFYPSIVSYLFGYGSLGIDTAAGDVPGHMELHIVRHHEKAAHLIMCKCFEEKKI